MASNPNLSQSNGRQQQSAIPHAQQPLHFDGPEYIPARDQKRLSDKRFRSNKIIVGEKVAILVCPLQGRRDVKVCALIDKDDLPAASQLTWRARSLPKDGGAVYVLGTIPKLRKAIQLHRFILGLRSQIDHKNRRGSDNRRCNMRPATASQNQANRRSSNRLGLKGVRLDKGRYEARIKAKGKTISLGRFETAEEAARAYDAAALEHYGEFAWTNRRHIENGLFEYSLEVRTA